MNAVKSFADELKRVGNYGLTLLFPRGCDLCGGSVEELGDGAACANCWNETELFDSSVSFCSKCGIPSGVAGAPSEPEKVRCRQCDDDHYDVVRSLGPYAGALRASVLALKRQPEVAGRLLDLLTSLAQSEPLDRTQVVMPVPLHPERERERGFNQASALSEALARRLKLPLDDTALIRAQDTARHRAEMDARARRESVEGVFEVAYPRRVHGRSILLIDDVQTTGATLSACAQVLKEAGAAQVFGLTIARAR
jgi:ComF family protein